MEDKQTEKRGLQPAEIRERRKLREYLFKLIFLAGFYESDELSEQADAVLEGDALEEPDDPEEIEELTPDDILTEECPFELSEEEKYAVKQRFWSWQEHLAEIDEKLNATARGWKTSRMAKTDLAVLRLAVYEMFYDEAVPVGVAINEAVELAKKYGGSESYSFINGILGSLARS